MAKNIKEAKELVNTYRSITIEQLNTVYLDNNIRYLPAILTKITRFGTYCCTLCTPIDANCIKCIHTPIYDNLLKSPCMEHHTYQRINNAETIEELYNAIQERANYLEELIKEVEKDNT